MVLLNIDETLKRAAIERAKPKPTPKVVFKKSTRKQVPPARPTTKPEIKAFPQISIKADISAAKESLKTQVLNSMELEYNQVMTERKKLSSQIWKMVENGATREELEQHYTRIESYRPSLQKIYDDMEYIKLHGEVPRLQETAQEPETIPSLKLKRKALIDKRCKLKAKMAKKVSQKPTKYVEWELELEIADVEYNDIDKRIKILEGKA